MGTCSRTLVALAVCGAQVLAPAGLVEAQEVWRFILPEQRRMEIRHPRRLPKARLPRLPSPPTVADPQWNAPPENLSLDEAIRTALANSEVIRVLAGVTATSSGRTIYDPAITNTGIDQARGPFDPKVEVQNNFNRRETPQVLIEKGFDPSDPSRERVIMGGDATQDYEMAAGVSKTTITGGSLNLGVSANPLRSNAADSLLNPRSNSSVDLSFTQPLLQGAGGRANLVPIVLARIDTERSFFQLKDSVEQLVGGVVEAYWALVFARTDLWARRQQVEQGRLAVERAEAMLKQGLGKGADVPQARSALANFRANLVSSEANVLQQEAALRNILGRPPYEPVRIVPVSPPTTERLGIDWDNIVSLAEQQRPDLIELKLVLEADQQQLLRARNQALPSVDAMALYRWNGLEGRTPDRRIISSLPGEFTGWQLGVKFSVPLGLRQSRAELRQMELIIMRDRANLQQGFHNATHVLAASYRDLAQSYARYQAFQQARAAAGANLDQQYARWRRGFADFLDYRVAITDWGNAVSAEAQSLTQYNVELANLELQTGTILETHGVRFFEERYASIGPLGRLSRRRCYPRDYRPGPNADRYQSTSEPAEKIFNLEVPIRLPPTKPEPTPGPLPERERLRLEIPEPIPPPAPQR